MISEIHQNLINKKYSVRELTEDYLSRAKKENEKINAFITITEDEALLQADSVDRLVASGGEVPLLAGIPASVKDLIMTEGVRTTAASKILENYIAPYDATVVEKLKAQGLVLVGKNNCDEFAMGSSTENSAFGPTKNPHDLSRVSGGTSGGSAAAVAADLSVYSLGTDTGGSVRQPASFCGVVGLKPTYGAVSRYGLIADASSLDQIGVLAKTVADARIVFETIKGQDEKDSTSVNSQQLTVNSKGDLKNIKIGIPKEYFIAGMDKESEALVKNMIKRAENFDAEIVEVSLPHTEEALAVYYIIQPAEASANLARYDGIRYGNSVRLRHPAGDYGGQAGNINSGKSKGSLIDDYKHTRGKFLGPEVKRRIMLGTYVLSAGYYDAYYKQAQKVRSLIRQDFTNVFAQVDFLMTPVAPNPAFKLGEKISDPLAMYLEDVFTVPVNVAGLPALSLPAGKTKTGLPVGAQIIGPWWSDERILGIGEVIEDKDLLFFSPVLK